MNKPPRPNESTNGQCCSNFFSRFANRWLRRFFRYNDVPENVDDDSIYEYIPMAPIENQPERLIATVHPQGVINLLADSEDTQPLPLFATVYPQGFANFVADSEETALELGLPWSSTSINFDWSDSSESLRESGIPPGHLTQWSEFQSKQSPPPLPPRPHRRLIRQEAFDNVSRKSVKTSPPPLPPRLRQAPTWSLYPGDGRVYRIYENMITPPPLPPRENRSITSPLPSQTRQAMEEPPNSGIQPNRRQLPQTSSQQTPFPVEVNLPLNPSWLRQNNENRCTCKMQQARPRSMPKYYKRMLPHYRELWRQRDE